MGTVYVDPALKHEAERKAKRDEMRQKAIKLFEAATGAHDLIERNGEHEWRECRRCLAIRELDTREGHTLMVVALKVLKNAQPVVLKAGGR